MLKQRLDDGENSITFFYLNLHLLAQLADVLVNLVQELCHVLRLLRFWAHVVLRVQRSDFALEHQDVSVRRNKLFYLLRHGLESIFLSLSNKLVLELRLR